jgi:PAS domain S-box-containing protein
MSLHEHSEDPEVLRRRLYEIADDEMPLEEKQRKILELGRAFLDTDCGRIERKNRDTESHDIVVTSGAEIDTLEEGTTVDRTVTYCRRAVETGSTVAFADVDAEELEAKEAYETHGQRCYIGAPITVDGEVYGTICFNDADPRTESFTTSEKLFVELAASVLGREIEAERYERKISEQGRAREISEQKYQTLLEAAPNAIVIAEADTGRIAGVNRRATELTGYSESELEGMRVFELHPDSDREKYAKLFERAPDQTTRSRFDDGSSLYVRRADGTDVPVEISANTVEVAGRKLIQGIFRDISERRQQERELERNQEFLRRTQEAASLGGWELDISTGELRCTDEINRIYGLPPEYDLTFDEAVSGFHSEDEARAGEAYTELVTDLEPFDIEVRLETDSRGVRWVRVIGGPVHGDDGEEIVGFRGVTQDVTDRHEREADLRIKNRAVAEASVGIFIGDATTSECEFIYTNEEFQRLTGYEESEVLGRSYRFLEKMTNGTMIERVQEAIETGESQTARLLHRRADGTRFWSELTVTPVGDEDGEITHCVGFLRDITPVKRRERLVGVLNRVLRHNLRNDMNIVGGYAERIAARADDETAGLADQIRSTAADLTALSEKARTLEETMADPATPESRDVAADVRGAVEQLREAYPSVEFGIEAPEVCRAVATHRLERALYEIGENAAKHAGESSVVFEVERTEDGHVAVEICDSGPGLSETERDVVERGRETPMGHGQGLGLWLVNWIVTGTGGDLSVEADNGTTVRVQLLTTGGDGEEKPPEYFHQAALGTEPE